MAASAEQKTDKPSTFARLRERYEWLDHIVRAGTRYTERHGTHYAAAIAYFSVLSLVPLVMIGFAVAGYVLFFNPALLGELRSAINENLPGQLGAFLNPIIDQAIAARGAVGLIGILGALYSGIGWMSNLREALSEQWAQVPQPPALPKRLLFDLLSLVGLGLALVASFAITGIASGAAAAVLNWLGLGAHTWAQFLLGLFGVVLGLFANWLIFMWVIARLPRQHVTLRSAAKAAAVGAVGFEILKRVMQIYLASVTGSPTGVLFGPIIGLLVFAYFASQFVLFVTAWAATSRENEQEEPAPAPAPAVIRPEVVVRSGPSGGTAAGLVGAGLLTGLVGGRLLRGRR